MVICSICRKDLGIFEIKHKHVDKEGNEIILCSNCNVEFQEKENQRIKKENENIEKRALELNSKWQYKVIHLKTMELEYDLQKRLTDKILNEYGDKGWELINIISPTINNKLAYNLFIVPIALVFKRKI